MALPAGTLELFICGGYVALLGNQYPARHSFCSKPGRSLQLRTKAVPCCCGKDDCAIPKGHHCKGNHLQTHGTYKVDCYVDADFAGLHGCDPQEMPTSACSRTGYIMFFGGCPLLWKSKLQTETALSTFHAEYMALAAAMHQLIVVQQFLQDLVACLSLKPKQPKIHATVHEDNASAPAFANNQRLSDQSKSLNTKYHFFWEWINSGMASVVKCSTHEQQADYMTKGLVPKN